MKHISINSSRAYQVIKRAAQDWLKKAGFRVRGSSGGWVKMLDENLELGLLFQCDKNGWDWYGSQFTLNFLLTGPGEEDAPLLDCRFKKLIDAADGEVWVALTNRVIAKLQGVKRPALADWEYPEDGASELTPISQFSAITDPWMRFYHEEDITMWWGEFLEPRMDKMIRRFLSLPKRA